MILLTYSGMHSIQVWSQHGNCFLVRVYSDIVTMVGKGNGSFLVLLDLSTAFDTIHHDTLFVILNNYVGIAGNALQLLKSYFSDRSQRVLIDDVMSAVC